MHGGVCIENWRFVMQVQLPDELEQEVKELSERTGIPTTKLLQMLSETAFLNLPVLADMAAAWVKGADPLNLPRKMDMPVGEKPQPPTPDQLREIPPPMVPSPGHHPAPKKFEDFK